MSKYKEIFKLKRMLEKEGIPFEFFDRFNEFPDMKKICPDFEHYQICYPRQGEGRWISVIEGFGTYGGDCDKLEIMGGLTPYERFVNYDSNVAGWLSARTVFHKIKNHYEKEIKDGKY